MIEPLIDKFIEGKPVTFGDARTERPWKDTIINSLNDMNYEPLEKAKVTLDFTLIPKRFMRQGKQPRNDLDNLSKPVLDAVRKLKLNLVLLILLNIVLANVIGVKELQLSVLFVVRYLKLYKREKILQNIVLTSVLEKALLVQKDGILGINTLLKLKEKLVKIVKAK